MHAFSLSSPVPFIYQLPSPPTPRNPSFPLPPPPFSSLSPPSLMSTDLQFRQASLPPIKIQSPPPPKADTATSPCRTPTGAEHKIPVMLSCPPAPRKPRRAVGCKRRIRDFDFFDTVNREEVEDFFRSNFQDIAAGDESKSTKRRCKP